MAVSKATSAVQSPFSSCAGCRNSAARERPMTEVERKAAANQRASVDFRSKGVGPQGLKPLCSRGFSSGLKSLCRNLHEVRT